MSFPPEKRHLISKVLCPTDGEPEYNTFNDQQENGNTVLPNEEESELSVAIQVPDKVPDAFNENATLSEQGPREDNEYCIPCTSMLSCLKSYTLLKYIAIVFGLWSELHRCTLCLIIPISIAMLYLSVDAQNSYYCTMNCFSNYSKYEDTTFDPSVGNFNTQFCIFAVISSYLTMIYCIRRLSCHPKALRFSQAFKLVKPTAKMVNLILALSICVVGTSMLSTLIFVPGKNGTFRANDFVNGSTIVVVFHYETTVEYQEFYIAWLQFSTIAIWQGVIVCLVFGVAMKALCALIDECINKIISVSADSVDDYIQVHQELCQKVESTFAAYKMWFIVNTFVHILLIFVSIIESITSLFFLGDFFFSTYKYCLYNVTGDDLDPSFSYILMSSYHLLTLFLYSSFVCYYPWYVMAHLKRSYLSIVNRLNSKTDWSRRHPFKNRMHLNTFLNYAKNTESCSFMQFTCSSKIPYISVLLAVTGLSLTIFNQFRNPMYRNPPVYNPSMPAVIIRNSTN